MFAAVVVSNRLLCREHYQLRLRIDEVFPQSAPGQFVQVLCQPPATVAGNAVPALDPQTWCVGGTGQSGGASAPELSSPWAMLRRPFSIADRTTSTPAAGNCVLDLVHRVVGTGTAWLATLKKGDSVSLIGPLGGSFRLPEVPATVLLVGGGVGLPPMFYAARVLRSMNVPAVAFVGAMRRDLLAIDLDTGTVPDVAGLPSPCARPFLDHGCPTVVTTDDGSCGFCGTIVDGLRAYLAGLPAAARLACLVLTCGPTGMMRATAAAAVEAGVACQVCLEQAMACGMSTCQSCAVPIATEGLPHGISGAGRPWRYRLACTDGPVFDATEVVWESMG